MKDVYIEWVWTEEDLVDPLTKPLPSKIIIFKLSDMVFDTWLINFSANERLLVYTPCNQLVGYTRH
jgi:hypothetical protein